MFEIFNNSIQKFIKNPAKYSDEFGNRFFAMVKKAGQTGDFKDVKKIINQLKSVTKSSKKPNEDLVIHWNRIWNNNRKRLEAKGISNPIPPSTPDETETNTDKIIKKLEELSKLVAKQTEEIKKLKNENTAEKITDIVIKKVEELLKPIVENIKTTTTKLIADTINALTDEYAQKISELEEKYKQQAKEREREFQRQLQEQKGHYESQLEGQQRVIGEQIQTTNSLLKSLEELKQASTTQTNLTNLETEPKEENKEIEQQIISLYDYKLDNQGTYTFNIKKQSEEPKVEEEPEEQNEEETNTETES